MAIQSATRNIILRREDAFRATLQFISVEETTSVRKPIDLSKFEIMSEVRYSTTNELWFDLPLNVSDADNGIVTIYFTSPNTRDLYDNSVQLSGVYDIQLKELSTGDIATIMVGTITIVNDITEDVARPIK